MKIIIVGIGNIGFEVIKLLSSQHEVIAIARSYPDYLKKLSSSNGNITFLKGDATKIEDMQKIAESPIFNDKNGIDALVCSLGHNTTSNAIDDHSGFKESFEINVYSNLIPIQVFSELLLKKKHSKFVLVSASSGHHADTRLTGYPASKWALENIFSALREEMAIHNITVDVIAVPTIKNKRSKVWEQKNGIDPVKIANKVVKSINSPKNRRIFLPKKYILFRLTERLFPGVLNLVHKLKFKYVRKKKYKKIELKSAFITGAAYGLGRELAILYSRKVDDLYILDKDIKNLNILSKDLSLNSKAKIHPIVIDLMSPSQIELVMKKITKVDLLINNAGVGYFYPITNTDLKFFHDCYQINFFSSTFLTSLLFNKVEKPKKIINILSTTAIKGRSKVGLYSSAKAAFWNYTRSLRRNWGNEIQVLEVIPSFMNNTNYYKNSNVVIKNNIGSTPQSTKSKIKSKVLKVGQLTSEKAALMIFKAESKGKDIVFIPNVKARLFLFLETISPSFFSKIFK